MSSYTDIRESTCPACGYHVAVPFYDGGMQPLATIAWPTDAEKAKQLPQLPNFYVRCIDCGHVYNADFDYENIPYSEKPNLMFNKGENWSSFILDLRERILRQLPADPVIVEIGHGDGSFISALAKGGSGRYVGFDPHGMTTTDGNLELRAELFDPSRHLEELKPDIVITRHVLEHLINPLGFLQKISFNASCLKIKPLAYFEVPCIDRAIESGRTVDFYYEHSSQFTTTSFTRMLSNCAAEILEIGHGYDGEVVFGFLRLGERPIQVEHAREAQLFLQGARDSLHTISEQLQELLNQGKRIAVWGGTGKSAAFMQHFKLDATRFPLVVDDDINKVDTYVPGTGQRIRFRDWLVENPVDVIIIPPQWRAMDIVAVMARSGIKAESILIEHNQKLIDFYKVDHPYKNS